ncbi:MAG: serine/threonine protein kinase, partial [Mycobacterium sp.]
PPYTSASAGVLVNAHTTAPIPQPSAIRPGIPKAFDAVIARGMAKKPEDRYASAGDLALAAHDALSNPDQDHAANILRGSQEATLPGTAIADPPPPGPAVTTPPPGPVPQYPSTPYLSPAGSGPVPPQTPLGPVPSGAGRPWTPDSGPIPAASQPTPTPQHYQGSGGNWGGPPLGAPPPWSQGQQPPAKPKRNPWPIVAGVAALIVVLVVAAIGISIAIGGNDTDNQQAGRTTTTTTTSIPATTPAGDLQSKLLRMLPAGYPSGTCKPTAPKSNTIWASAVAMLECGQNTSPGGPSRGVYGLFPNPDALNSAFNDDIHADDMQLMDCPGAGPSPDSWHHDSSPTVTAGMIACGTYNNHPNLVWSNHAKLTLSDVSGDLASIEDLHTWWTKHGG